jgi:hypothetical protein
LVWEANGEAQMEPPQAVEEEEGRLVESQTEWTVQSQREQEEGRWVGEEGWHGKLWGQVIGWVAPSHWDDWRESWGSSHQRRGWGESWLEEEEEGGEQKVGGCGMECEEQWRGWDEAVRRSGDVEWEEDALADDSSLE